MTRSIANLIMVLGAIVLVCSGCNQDDCGKLPHSLLYTYDNGAVIEVLNNSKIDVTEKPDAFDLSFSANGIFKNISVVSTDTQCSAEIIGEPEAGYNAEGRLLDYTQTVHIDMRQEKSIGLTVKFRESKYRTDNSISFSLIRK